MAKYTVPMVLAIDTGYHVQLKGPTNPIDTGTGDTDLQCADCREVVLAAQVLPYTDAKLGRDALGVVATCAKCGAKNDVPFRAGDAG